MIRQQHHGVDDKWAPSLYRPKSVSQPGARRVESKHPATLICEKREKKNSRRAGTRVDTA
jgi:hypothetical protein